VGDAAFDWFVANFENLIRYPLGVFFMVSSGIAIGWFVKGKTVQSEVAASKMAADAAQHKVDAAAIRADAQNAKHPMLPQFFRNHKFGLRCQAHPYLKRSRTAITPNPLFEPIATFSICVRLRERMPAPASGARLRRYWMW